MRCVHHPNEWMSFEGMRGVSDVFRDVLYRCPICGIQKIRIRNHDLVPDSRSFPSAEYEEGRAREWQNASEGLKGRPDPTPPAEKEAKLIRGQVPYNPVTPMPDYHSMTREEFIRNTGGGPMALTIVSQSPLAELEEIAWATKVLSRAEKEHKGYILMAVRYERASRTDMISKHGSVYGDDFIKEISEAEIVPPEMRRNYI